MFKGITSCFRMAAWKKSEHGEVEMARWRWQVRDGVTIFEEMGETIFGAGAIEKGSGP